MTYQIVFGLNGMNLIIQMILKSHLKKVITENLENLPNLKKVITKWLGLTGWSTQIDQG